MQPKAPAQTFPRKGERMARHPRQAGPKAPPPKARRRAGCQRVRCAVAENYRRPGDAADSVACQRFFLNDTERAPPLVSHSLSDIHEGRESMAPHALKRKQPLADHSTITSTHINTRPPSIQAPCGKQMVTKSQAARFK